MSEYGDSEEPGVSIWQELQDETVRLDSRKSSSSSQVTLQCRLLASLKGEKIPYYLDESTIF